MYFVSVGKLHSTQSNPKLIEMKTKQFKNTVQIFAITAKNFQTITIRPCISSTIQRQPDFYIRQYYVF